MCPKVLHLTIGKSAVLAKLNVAIIRQLNLDVLENPLEAINSGPSESRYAEIAGTSVDSDKQVLTFE